MGPSVVGGPIRSHGPARVNLIGDHTDYNGGLALPMAIDLGITADWLPTGAGSIAVVSDAYPGERVDIPLLPDPSEVAAIEPGWARLAASMVAVARPESGGHLTLTSTVPRGSGLSSSAALCVVLADVLGVRGDARMIAGLCREAEHRIGVPVGLMDPLVCAGGRAGHALRIDFTNGSTRDVAVPASADIVVVDSGQRRDLRTSGYAERVAECEAAAAVVGPLGLIGVDDLTGLRDPLLRRRARHVLTECARVDRCASALEAGDLVTAGSAMDESHLSLAEDFEVSTPQLDRLVRSLRARDGVVGCRMTGAGFGGCVVALCEPGALDPDALGHPAWRVRAVDGTVSARG